MQETRGRFPLPVDDAIPVARRIAEALEAAHGHGVIHLVKDPAWRLSDMGDARIELRAAEHHEERPGAALPVVGSAPAWRRALPWALAALLAVALAEFNRRLGEAIGSGGPEPG